MDLRLLEKFFDNHCSPDEVAEVLRWFASPEDKAETLARLEKYWKEYRPDGAVPRLTAHQTLHDIHREIARREDAGRQPARREDARRSPNLSPSHSSRSVSSARRSSKLPQYFAVAAIITLVIVGAIVVHRLQPSLPQPIATVRQSTAPGQQRAFRLPDGTLVKLNVNSELTYSAAQADGPRGVSLRGEAFFEVAHDPQRPFTVTARGVATTALGTSFNVQAYDTTVAVALVTGKVKVAKQQSSTVLTPGERIQYFPHTAPQKDRYDPLSDLAWKEGTLHFSQATLPQVVQRLERWYGVTITLKGIPAQRWSYSGTFTKETLENVLMGISYTQDFAFDIHEKQVTITFSEPQP